MKKTLERSSFYTCVPKIMIRYERFLRYGVRRMDKWTVGWEKWHNLKQLVVEIISVAINDSSDVLWFGLYLINIFTKSTKAERCTEVTFKLALYCLPVIVDDLNLSWRCRYKHINILGTRNFVLPDSHLGAP